MSPDRSDAVVPDTDRVAVVVGAGSGIGQATAIRLAPAGIQLVLVGDDPERLAATAAASNAAGGVLTLVADVSDNDAVEAMAAQVRSRWGRLDKLVVSAGINGVWAPLDQITPAEWRRTLEVNLTGTFLVLHHCVDLLKVARGAVVVVSSIHGNRVHSLAGSTAYSCSKIAQTELVFKLALELAPSGVRINAVCPGSTNTQINASRTSRHLDQIDQGVRFDRGWVPLAPGDAATPDQVASVITFLLSDDADRVSGSELYVDGAQSLLIG